MAKTAAPLQEAANEATKYDSARSMLADKMPNMVKGVGFAQPGGVKPLEDQAEIMHRSFDAEKAIRKATKQGIANPSAVRKGMNPAFSSQFGLFAQNSPAYGAGMHQLTQQLQQAFRELGKNVTLTSPDSNGLVPFDLVAPSRLIYPVYSPLRNKIPRVPGQGTSRIVKEITGISGSQTGASGGAFKRTSISELNGGGIGAGGNWPMSLPDPGTQDAADLNVPYRFFGLSESLSWLAQFAGQGYEDISALANLILLQEFMLSEEAQILAGRTATLGTPGKASGTARAAAAGETALTGFTTDIFLRVTATTMLGESPVGAASNAIAVSTGDVVEVTIPTVAGATGYNVYVSTGASDPGAASAWLMASTGGSFVLQGALPTSGKAASAVTNTSSSANDYDGLLAILSGTANSSAYPAGFKAGYYNPNVGDVLSVDVVNAALAGLWNGPGAYRANPSELIVEGSDAMRLAESMVANSNNQSAYRLLVEQGEVGGIRAGAAVSEFQNPITRSVVNILVHPWLPQGNALLMSYTLPMAMSNVSNAWENVMVQDYLSISWPVIDASFRYSMFMYGALVGQAPQYSGLLSGITPVAASALA